MVFRFYSNTISHAGRGLAFIVFMFAVMLAGIGAAIIAFPQFFAYLVATLLFIAAAGCFLTSIKMYFASRRFESFGDRTSEDEFRRPQGRIHELEDFDDSKE